MWYGYCLQDQTELSRSPVRNFPVMGLQLAHIPFLEINDRLSFPRNKRFKGRMGEAPHLQVMFLTTEVDMYTSLAYDTSLDYHYYKTISLVDKPFVTIKQ